MKVSEVFTMGGGCGNGYGYDRYYYFYDKECYNGSYKYGAVPSYYYCNGGFRNESFTRGRGLLGVLG
jgi:hypothetical protein